MQPLATARNAGSRSDGIAWGGVTVTAICPTRVGRPSAIRHVTWTAKPARSMPWRSRNRPAWNATHKARLATKSSVGVGSGVVTACVQRLVDAYLVSSNIDCIFVAADRMHGHWIHALPLPLSRSCPQIKGELRRTELPAFGSRVATTTVSGAGYAG